jgi:hypothetical protein
VKRAHSWGGAAGIAVLTAVLVSRGVSWWYIGPILGLALIVFAAFLAWRDEYHETFQAIARADWYQADAEAVRADAGRLEGLDSCLRSAYDLRSGAARAGLRGGADDVRAAVALQSSLGNWITDAKRLLPADFQSRLERPSHGLFFSPGLPTGSASDQAEALDGMIAELERIAEELRNRILVGKLARGGEATAGDPHVFS